MKKIITIISCILITQLIYAQCLTGVTFTVSPDNPETAFQESDLLVDGPDYSNVYFFPDGYGCGDVGLLEVVVIYTLENDQDTCITSVTIVGDGMDVTPPVLILEPASVCLDDDGTLTLNPWILNNGTSDFCSNVNLVASPSVFTTADIGQNVVLITATDEAGNTSEAFTSLTILDGDFDCVDVVYGTLTTSQEDTTVFSIKLFTFWFVDDTSVLCDASDILIEVYDQLGNLVASGFDFIYMDTPGYYDYYLSIPGSSIECSGNLQIDMGPQVPIDCQVFSEDNIQWPGDLTVATSYEDESDISELNIFDDYGFTFQETTPVVFGTQCINENTLVSYGNTAITDQGGSYEIERTWIVWNLDAPEETEEIQYVQYITVLPIQSFICDTESNESSLGDCGSGHSDTDDVEWPADIEVSDFRIEPNELTNYSGVELKNAQPQFVSGGLDYSFNYTDEVLEVLNQTSVVINRTWKVDQVDNIKLNVEYTQEIIIHAASLSNIAFVETWTDRPMPGVTIANGVLTDNAGFAQLPNSQMPNPMYSDSPNNGVNLLDLIVMRQGVLEIIELSPFQKLAADINGVSEVTTLDIVLVQRAIIGLEAPLTEWSFVESQAGLINPRSNYVGYKVGDVNDSAALGDLEFNQEVGSLVIEDDLLNLGETYTVDLNLSAISQSFIGLELHLDYDVNALEIVNVSNNIDIDDSLLWAANGGTLNIIYTQSELQALSTNDGEADNVITLELVAKDNAILADVLSLNETFNSMVSDENLELIKLEMEIENAITSKIDATLEETNVVAFPNPASDMITFGNLDGFDGDYTIQMFDAFGQLVSFQKNQNTVSLDDLSSGIYVYYVSNTEKRAMGKVTIQK